MMAKTLMKALHTEMTADLPAVAALLQKKGRGKDTILAHITPKEAALLKTRGGRGSKNPDTGLMEFEGADDTISFGEDFFGSPEQTEAVYNIPQTETPAFSGGFAPSTGGTQFADQTAAMQPPAYSPTYTPPAAPTQSTMGSLANIQGVPLEQGGLGTPGLGAISGQMGTVGTSYVPPTPTYGGGVLSGGAPKPPDDAGLLSQLNKALGTNLTAGQVFGGGALGALGVSQAQNAAAQAQQAKQEFMKQAAPYQKQGQEMAAAAKAGQLSTSSQQAYEAARARAAQAGQAAGGGVGVVQSEVALEGLRQQLLAGDLNIALQIQAIGDKIAQGAISAGIQADQYVNNLTNTYANNVARVLMGVTPGTTANTATTGVPA